jgi:hypothetical protein
MKDGFPQECKGLGIASTGYESCGLREGTTDRTLIELDVDQVPTYIYIRRPGFTHEKLADEKTGGLYSSFSMPLPISQACGQKDPRFGTDASDLANSNAHQHDED